MCTESLDIYKWHSWKWKLASCALEKIHINNRQLSYKLLFWPFTILIDSCQKKKKKLPNCIIISTKYFYIKISVNCYFNVYIFIHSTNSFIYIIFKFWIKKRWLNVVFIFCFLRIGNVDLKMANPKFTDVVQDDRPNFHPWCKMIVHASAHLTDQGVQTSKNVKTNAILSSLISVEVHSKFCFT